MDLRQLRYFVAAAEEGNISRAAKRIFLTQPALSRQIKALEEEVGQCLFNRQAHSIQLTPAGELLVQEARELLSHADAVLEKVRSAGSGLRLSVGYAPSFASGLLSAAVASFTQVHPKARVELFDLSSAEMLAGVESGKLDVALTVPPGRGTRGLVWTTVLQTPLQVALPAGHPLAKRAKVPVAEFAKGPLLAFCQRDYPEYWEALTAWLRRHGERPRIAGEYDGIESLLAAVGAGQGIALVAARRGRLLPEGVRLKPVFPAPEPLCIAACTREDRTADQPLAVFVAELRRAAAAFG